MALRRAELILHLREIFPISVSSHGGIYEILRIPLPVISPGMDIRADDNRFATALGYLALVIQLMSRYCSLPPRYPIVFQGSRSRIYDYITALKYQDSYQ